MDIRENHYRFGTQKNPFQDRQNDDRDLPIEHIVTSCINQNSMSMRRHSHFSCRHLFGCSCCCCDGNGFNLNTTFVELVVHVES